MGAQMSIDIPDGKKGECEKSKNGYHKFWGVIAGPYGSMYKLEKCKYCNFEQK
jgi:hypothetical protein